MLNDNSLQQRFVPYWSENMALNPRGNPPPEMTPPNSGVLYSASDQMAQTVNGFIANNPRELAKEAECHREVEVFRAKESIKTNNKLIVSETKERSRNKHILFFETEEGITLQITNGLGSIIGSETIFHMKIITAYRIKNPDGNITCYIYKIFDTKKKTYEYIEISTLPLSVKVLKQYFIQFFNPSLQYAKEAWQYLEVTLSRYDYVPVIFPGLPGWLKENTNYRFIYGRDDILVSKLLHDIKDVTLPGATLTPEDSIASIKNFCNGENLPETLIMLLYRLTVLLAPLLSKDITIPKVSVIGYNSLPASNQLINTLGGVDNELNLDLYNKSNLIKRLATLSNVPVICFTRNFENGSSLSHLQEVISYCETIRCRKLPVVVCIPHVDQKTELFDIVVDSEKLPDLKDIENSFNALQRDIIKKIETSGEYFPNLLNKVLVSKYENIPDTFRIFYIMTDFISTMFENDTFPIGRLLKRGLDAIQAQAENPGNLLLQHFRTVVITAVDKHQLLVVPRKSAPFKTPDGKPRIYFDEVYYYIPTHGLKIISELGNLTSKACLKLRQKLAEEGFLKTYRNTFSHLEYSVDFHIEYAACSEKESGLAIVKTFFDDELGLTLYERGI